MSGGPKALDDLVGLLDLESLEVNLFRGESLDPDRVRLYGGEVLAQSLMAAGRTVEPGRRVHSMHAYFLKLGDPKVPVVYEVDRILATRFGVAAIDAVHDGEFGTMVALRGERIERVPIADAVRELKTVDPELLEVAGVFFG